MSVVGRIALPAQPFDFEALIGEARIAPGAEAILRENPAHHVTVSRYPKRGIAGARDAVAAARRAADTRVWSSLSGAARAKILLDVARRIEAEIETLRRIESLETGKPLANAEREMRGSAAHWEYAASLARHVYGDSYDTLGSNQLAMVLREPVGVVAIIVPWNYPLVIVSQKLPFALAMGCTAVLKPSEMTSGTALVLGRILREAGVPPGVVNIVPGYGDDVGTAICGDPAVDAITFTGSTRVGKAIAAKAGADLKRISLELGGKSAQIVCADADLDAAAAKVALGATRNSGQACVCGARLLVEKRIAGEFVERVMAHMAKIKVGDPLDPETEMGPLVSAAQHARVESYIEAGKRDGALHWSSGKAPAGWYVAPTIFTKVDPAFSIAREEIFGPVLSVIEFETVERAIEIANATPYGLSAGVWTRDLDKAFRFGRALDAGTVEVNTYMAGAPELPLAGRKDSGLGHERGRFAVEEFTRLKTLQLQLS